MIPGHLSDLPHRSEQDQIDFFEKILACTLRAEATKGVIVRTIRLAGQAARLVFAGTALYEKLMPAIEHLVVPTEEGGAPSLVLHVWDCESSGIAIAPPPVAQHCFTERGDIWTFHSPRIRSAYHWSDYSLSLFDAERGVGIFWVRSGNDLPYWTMASPFRSIFHWWMERHEAQLVHAAAVGTEKGAVLIAGPGGVGKSTTALSSLKAGLRYAGDDFVIITGGDTPRVHSLYRTAKVNAADVADVAAFAPRFLGRGSDREPEKAVMHLDTGVVRSMPLLTVLAPEFGGEAETRFATAEIDLVVGAAAYSTIALLPHAGPGTIDFIERLFARLPCRRMILGHRRAGAAEAIETLLGTILDRETLPATVGGTAATPPISVIIPTFNGARFLRDAVDSILAQDYPGLEIIIVDDGSDDDIAAAVESLPVPVTFLRQSNGGPSAARNTGIRAASSKLLAFLDVDDLWPRGKLSAALAWLKANADTDVVLGRAQLMEQDTNGDFRWVGNPAVAFKYYIGAALYRRRAFDRAGLFDPRLRLGEDSDWFANAAHTGVRVDVMDIVSLYVRRHASNSTRGLSGIELSPLRLARNALQRKRQIGSAD